MAGPELNSVGMQHIYMSVLGSFPFNSYLAALFTCIGGGVLAGVSSMSICMSVR